MDIAAISMGMGQMNLHQEAGMSVMKMAMNQGQEQVMDLVQMAEKMDVLQVDRRVMEQSVTPYLGTNIDVKL